MTFEFDDEYEERLREYHDWLGDQADYWGDDALWYVDEEGVVQCAQENLPRVVRRRSARRAGVHGGSHHARTTHP